MKCTCLFNQWLRKQVMCSGSKSAERLWWVSPPVPQDTGVWFPTGENGIFLTKNKFLGISFFFFFIIFEIGWSSKIVLGIICTRYNNVKTSKNTQKNKTKQAIKSKSKWFQLDQRMIWLPPFSLIATLENKTPAETFPKSPSLFRVIGISDRIHQSQPGNMAERSSEGHTSSSNW